MALARLWDGIENTVRDRLWLFSHEEGCQNEGWGFEADSRMTPTEACTYMNVPNTMLARYNGRPVMPFDRHLIAMRPLRRVAWSLTGMGGRTSDDEREHVLDCLRRFPNMSGVLLDDFFENTDENGKHATLSIRQLQEIRDQLELPDRHADIYSVIYSHQLDLPVQEHVEMCDVVTFWTWKARDLDGLEENFEKFATLTRNVRRAVGLYMYDFGGRQLLPLNLMGMQAEFALKWLRDGRIEAIILHATPICDLEFEAVEWSRRWVEEIGDEAL